jgi:H+/Cl- antiporter ClcA
MGSVWHVLSIGASLAFAFEIGLGGAAFGLEFWLRGIGNVRMLLAAARACHVRKGPTLTATPNFRFIRI